MADEEGEGAAWWVAGDEAAAGPDAAEEDARALWPEADEEDASAAWRVASDEASSGTTCTLDLRRVCTLDLHILIASASSELPRSPHSPG